MARQTFLTREFFVPASEVRTKISLLNLPQSLDGIKFLRESKITGGLTFLYEEPTKDIQKLDASFLPLNDEFTHITIHASYADGHSFNRDADIEEVLALFEQAIQAIITGREFQQPASRKKKSVSQALLSPFSGFAFLSIKKKYS